MKTLWLLLTLLATTTTQAALTFERFRDPQLTIRNGSPHAVDVITPANTWSVPSSTVLTFEFEPALDARITNAYGLDYSWTHSQTEVDVALNVGNDSSTVTVSETWLPSYWFWWGFYVAFGWFGFGFTIRIVRGIARQSPEL